MQKRHEDNDRQEDFFVGYSNHVPARLVRFLALVGFAFLLASGAAAFLISSNNNDTGSGYYAGDVNLVGWLQAEPGPLLRLPGDPIRGSAHAVMLSGDGKTGVSARAHELDGKLVQIAGTLVRRGSIDMLMTRAAAMQPQEGERARPAAGRQLGRFRLNGEICDGKCSLGAMHPGTGLAHKACANLCLTGGVPPVFVSTGPLAGTSFLLLTGPDGKALPDDVYDLVALRVVLDGEIVSFDDLLVFEVELPKKGL
jgi:hypothetical protein